jgi:hypothetical protein
LSPRPKPRPRARARITTVVAMAVMIRRWGPNDDLSGFLLAITKPRGK